MEEEGHSNATQLRESKEATGRVVDKDREPTTAESIKNLFWTHRYINTMLITVPVAIALGARRKQVGDYAVFALNIVAILPMAKLMDLCTDQVSMRIGNTYGALLNATFGNAVELIIGIIGLTKGLLTIVQASCLGSILSNLLLVLGMSLFAGGTKWSEQRFASKAAEVTSSILTVAAMGFILPAVLSLQIGAGINENGTVTDDRVLRFSRAVAFMLFVTYIAYLFFQMKTHEHFFISTGLDSKGIPYEPYADKLQKDKIENMTIPYRGSNLVQAIYRWLHLQERKKEVPLKNAATAAAHQKLICPPASAMQQLHYQATLQSIGSGQVDESTDNVAPKGQYWSGGHSMTNLGRKTHGNRPSAEVQLETLKEFLHEKQKFDPAFIDRIIQAEGITSIDAMKNVSDSLLSSWGLKGIEIIKYRQNEAKFFLTAGLEDADAAMAENGYGEDDGGEEEEKLLNLPVATIALGVVTILIAVCAEYMLGSIDGVASKGGISEIFIGVIILPVAGNAAEHVCAISAALRDKLDLSIGICIGSSVQIALGVTQFLVLFGWMISQPMSLNFGGYDVVVLFLTVIVVNYIIKDGATNWFEGYLLCICYACVAVGFFYLKPSDLFVHGTQLANNTAAG